MKIHFRVRMPYQLCCIVLFTIYLMCSCSNIKTYRSQIPSNLFIKTTSDSGSSFSKIHTHLEIYKVRNQCETVYQGTMQLKNQLMEAGIPSKHTHYLVFVFNRTGFLSSSSSSITYEGLFTPRANYRYEFKVTYIDDIYNVNVREINIHTKKSRAIELKALKVCAAY